MRLLVIEDNSDIRGTLVTALRHEGFAVDEAADGERGLFLAQTNTYDLVLLDNLLPKKNGREICLQLRADQRPAPILILSVRSDPAEKAELLDAGADDYLAKPYSHRELLSRIRALLRRPAALLPDILALGDLRFDISRAELRRGNKLIHLTPKETAVLELLLRHKEHVVSRGMIMEAGWDIEGDLFSKTIETHILNLRRKIDPKGGSHIVSVTGRGYKAVEKPQRLIIKK